MISFTFAVILISGICILGAIIPFTLLPYNIRFELRDDWGYLIIVAMIWGWNYLGLLLQYGKI